MLLYILSQTATETFLFTENIYKFCDKLCKAIAHLQGYHELEEDEIDYDLIRQAKVFHLGTLSMTDEPVRTATKKCLETAREAGCMISFDPNLRPPLWKSLDTARKKETECTGH